MVSSFSKDHELFKQVETTSPEDRTRVVGGLNGLERIWP
jgi:hypothetical protein